MKLRLNVSTTLSFVMALLAASDLHADSYTITSIQYPGAVQTSANGINDQGQIVGTWATANFALIGSYLYSNGAFTPIPVSPSGINDSDQILTQIGNTGYIYQSGAYTPISYPASARTYVSAISNNGYVTGTWYSASNVENAFLYQNGSYTLFPLTTYLVPQAINSQGIVVGSDEITAEGFIRNPNGSITELAYPGASFTGFYSINDYGEILGEYRGPGANAITPFLYLNGIFTPLPELTGVEIVTGLNNEGQIAGSFTPAESFIATPVPEPAAAAFVGLSLALGACAWRRKGSSRSAVGF